MTDPNLRGQAAKAMVDALPPVPDGTCISDIPTDMAHGVLSSVSTIGGGGDTMFPSPGMTPKQPLPGIGLHDPLHGRQACHELNSFRERAGQMSPQ